MRRAASSQTNQHRTTDPSLTSEELPEPPRLGPPEAKTEQPDVNVLLDIRERVALTSALAAEIRRDVKANQTKQAENLKTIVDRIEEARNAAYAAAAATESTSSSARTIAATSIAICILVLGAGAAGWIIRNENMLNTSPICAGPVEYTSNNVPVCRVER
jgi:hypothetical protein